MSTPRLTQQLAALRQSHLFLVLLTPDWFRDVECQRLYQEARTLGLPVRVLVAPGVRVPEDAFQGLRDLQLAVSQSAEQDVAQVRTWIAEIQS